MNLIRELSSYNRALIYIGDNRISQPAIFIPRESKRVLKIFK